MCIFKLKGVLKGLVSVMAHIIHFTTFNGIFTCKILPACHDKQDRVSHMISMYSV